MTSLHDLAARHRTLRWLCPMYCVREIGSVDQWYAVGTLVQATRRADAHQRQTGRYCRIGYRLEGLDGPQPPRVLPWLDADDLTDLRPIAAVTPEGVIAERAQEPITPLLPHCHRGRGLPWDVIYAPHEPYGADPDVYLAAAS